MCAALHAAAQFVDHAWAETLLGMMHERGKILNFLDWNQAMDACKNGNQPSAAQKLFSDMVQAQVEPNVITFALLVGAHSGEPPESIQAAASHMATYGIEPNVPFLDELVSALLGTRRQGVQVIQLPQALAAAARAPRSHLVAAGKVIRHAESAGLELSKLLLFFKKAIRQVQAGTRLK